ncbi:MAG: glycosyltransferase 87 family protein [Bacilli bacterium]|nr:glycosyltransferase 87 family protein [Bacilli bacterium]
MNTFKTKWKEGITKIDSFFNMLFDYFMKFFRKYYLWIAFAFILAISFFVRYAFFDYLSGDMHNFLLQWFNHLKANGGLKAMGDYPWTNTFGVRAGDYPVSYITLLALLSYLPFEGIVSIKLLSVFFDYVLAIGAVLIIREFNKNSYFSLLAFAILVFFPTSILNSAVWGQCDQLYVALIVWTVLFLIKKKHFLAMIFLGLALATKLQTTFFLPVLIFMWLAKKFKLRYLLVMFLVIFLTFIPSYIAGAPFSMPFNMYRSQIGLYTNANYGAGSLYAFFEFPKLYAGIKRVGVYVAFIAIGVTLLVLFHYKVPATPKNIIYVTALFSLVSPFFLPHMHERYFYMADAFLIIYVLVFKRKYIYAALMSFSSVLTYTHFLTGQYIFKFLDKDCVRLSALINLGLIIALIIDAKSVLEKEPAEELLELETEQSEV